MKPPKGVPVVTLVEATRIINAAFGWSVHPAVAVSHLRRAGLPQWSLDLIYPGDRTPARHDLECVPTEAVERVIELEQHRRTVEDMRAHAQLPEVGAPAHLMVDMKVVESAMGKLQRGQLVALHDSGSVKPATGALNEQIVGTVLGDAKGYPPGTVTIAISSTGLPVLQHRVK